MLCAALWREYLFGSAVLNQESQHRPLCVLFLPGKLVARYKSPQSNWLSDSEDDRTKIPPKSSWRRRWIASAVLTILGWLVFEPLGNLFWGWVFGRFSISQDALIATVVRWLQQNTIVVAVMGVVTFFTLALLFSASGLPRAIDRLFDQLKGAAGWFVDMLSELWDTIIVDI